MKKLKPCPFCGSKNVALSDPNDADDWMVECPDCGMAMIPPGEEPGATATKEEAVTAWNKRMKNTNETVKGNDEMDGKSYDEIRMENKPSKPKDHLFNVGDQLIVTIGAVSRPNEDSENEVNYLIVDGKSDEWIGEDTLSKSAIPLEADTANFVSGYKSGWKEGYEAAQKKDQEYLMEFMSHFLGEKEDNGEEKPEGANA